MQVQLYAYRLDSIEETTFRYLGYIRPRDGGRVSALRPQSTKIHTIRASVGRSSQMLETKPLLTYFAGRELFKRIERGGSDCHFAHSKAKGCRKRVGTERAAIKRPKQHVKNLNLFVAMAAITMDDRSRIC